MEVTHNEHFQENEKKNDNRLPMPNKVKRGLPLVLFLGGGGGPDGLLHHDGLCRPRRWRRPLTVINNLSTFIFGLIRAVGLILLGWGIVRWASPSRATTRPSVPTAS